MIIRAWAIGSIDADDKGELDIRLSMSQQQMHDALLAIMAELDPETRVAWVMEINEKGTE